MAADIAVDSAVGDVAAGQHTLRLSLPEVLVVALAVLEGHWISDDALWPKCKPENRSSHRGYKENYDIGTSSGILKNTNSKG